MCFIKAAVLAVLAFPLVLATLIEAQPIRNPSFEIEGVNPQAAESWFVGDPAPLPCVMQLEKVRRISGVDFLPSDGISFMRFDVSNDCPRGLPRFG